MNQRPDPDETREIHTRQRQPGNRPAIPWWQSVNRQVPPLPPPPVRPQPTPRPHPGTGPAGNRSSATPPPPAPAQQRPPHPSRAPEPVQTPVPPSRGPKPRSRRKNLIRIGIAVIAIEAVALAVVLSRLQGSDAKVLDVGSAQRGVEEVLMDPVDGYGAQSVTGVVCNDGTNPAVRRGAAFSCDAVVDGSPRKVAVVFQDDDGTYAVDRPR